MGVAIKVRKSLVAQILRTEFQIKPSLSDVLAIEKEVSNEYNHALKSLRNYGSLRKGSNLSYTNFMRDMMEIPDLAMIRMRRILAECKCCEKHQSRRPLCQEKKRHQQPDYSSDGLECNDDCQCVCRGFSRRLESALLGEYPLDINGQLWERTKKCNS
jgi:hypothetical protein